MKYQPVIGLEIHVQLLTKSKVFCQCSTRYGSTPNTQTCPVCLALPGALPVLNEACLELVLKTGIALKCKIADIIKFDRKNYFYPDLPKNYQISQFDKPIAQNGHIEILDEQGIRKNIKITKIHLEEDAGKLIHSDKDYSLVDFNRSGMPLMEIVTEPDINSPIEAFNFLNKLKNILKYLEVSDCNMEEGSLRCDANVSVKLKQDKNYGVKSEIKNMNSFKAVKNALDFEIKRQIETIEKSNKIIQETRLWDETKKVTTAMRSKEEAHDYRYFPDPDLVSFDISKDLKDRIKLSLPELPDEKKKRFTELYNLPEYDAEVITSDKYLSDFFDECCKKFDNYKLVSNWFMGPLMEILNEKGETLDKLDIKAEDLVKLLNLTNKDKINISTAKMVFKDMLDSNKKPEDIINEKNLIQISDNSELEKLVNEVIAENQKSVDDFKSGKKKAIMYLVGQTMKKTQGKANAEKVKKILEKELNKIKGG